MRENRNCSFIDLEREEVEEEKESDLRNVT